MFPQESGKPAICLLPQVIARQVGGQEQADPIEDGIDLDRRTSLAARLCSLNPFCAALRYLPRQFTVTGGTFQHFDQISVHFLRLRQGLALDPERPTQ